MVRNMLSAFLVGVLLAACQTTPDEVVGKVLQDFGLRDRPEGYVSGSDRVLERLGDVAAAEMQRMNLDGQHGDVKFHQENEFRGKYYKEVKVYEGFFPTDAKPISRSVDDTRSYHGYIQYEYRIFQGPRKDSRTEAAAETATIPTDQTGRETYRYTFTGSGEWNGGKGQRARR